MSKITDEVTALALPIAKSLNVELWDVEFVREGGERYLRIFIDSAEGIFISQCEEFSRSIDPLLDDADLIDGAYILEVSSAGLERTLKKPEHFIRFIGDTVEVKLFKAIDGAKKHRGTLLAYENGNVSINSGGQEITFPSAVISQVKLSPDFSQYR